MNTVGFKNLDIFHLIGGSQLKKDLLYFDEILIDEKQLQMCINLVDGSKNEPFQSQWKNCINEIEYLQKEGLVQIKNTTNFFENFIPVSDLDLIDFQDAIKTEFDEPKTEEERQKKLISLVSLQNIESNLNARLICSKLNEINIFNIKPIVEIRTMQEEILPYLHSSKENKVEKNFNIANLVLKRFPVPDSTTSWEEIIEFKNNSNLRVHRLGLMNWINEMGNSNNSLLEIEQKLEYLLERYEEQLKLEKIKYSSATIELFITTSLEIVENIIKLNWSKTAKKIFELRSRKVDLLFGETLAPGREVAYLSKLNKEFL